MSVPDGARKVAFAVLALALAGAAAFAFLQAGKVDDRLSRETRRSAEHAAEAVASRLTTEDVDGPLHRVPSNFSQTGGTPKRA